MKKILIIVLGLMLMTSCGEAQEYDVPSEARPSITKHQISGVFYDRIRKEARVIVTKGYMSGATFMPVDSFEVIFRDVADDPSTPQDETSTEFTDFVAFTQVSVSKVATSVKTKLGIN